MRSSWSGCQRSSRDLTPRPGLPQGPTASDPSVTPDPRPQGEGVPRLPLVAKAGSVLPHACGGWRASEVTAWRQHWQRRRLARMERPSVAGANRQPGPGDATPRAQPAAEPRPQLAQDMGWTANKTRLWGTSAARLAPRPAGTRCGKLRGWEDLESCLAEIPQGKNRSLKSRPGRMIEISRSSFACHRFHSSLYCLRVQLLSPLGSPASPGQIPLMPPASSFPGQPTRI